MFCVFLFENYGGTGCFLHDAPLNSISPCDRVYDALAYAPFSSSSSSSSFCGLYVRQPQFPFLPPPRLMLQPWDLALHDHPCGGLYGDPLLENVGMDLGEHLQEGQLDIHHGVQDKDELLGLDKALSLEVLLDIWLGSHQHHQDKGLVGTLDLEAGGMLLEEVQQGCSQGGRQGLEDLIRKYTHTYIYLYMHSSIQNFF